MVQTKRITEMESDSGRYTVAMGGLAVALVIEQKAKAPWQEQRQVMTSLPYT